MKTIILFFSACVAILPAYAQIPTFTWAKAIGGSGTVIGNSVCTDAAGNSYTIGTFNAEADFNPNPTETDMLASFGDDVFVLKLDGEGDFVWAIAIGGNGSDRGNSIALDGDEDLIITGSFEEDVDFDPGSGTTILSSIELNNIFIAKLDTDANLIWAKGIGDTGNDVGNSIATDQSGNIYATGYFHFTVDFDPNAGTFPLTADGLLDGYILKLDPDGDFEWATQFGNDEDDQGNGITITETGQVCVTGSFGYEESNDDTHSSIFIAQYTSTGNSVWEKQIGYAENDSYHFGKAITTDEAGSVFVTGAYYNTMDFDPGSGTFILNSGNYELGFILKLSSDGSFNWAHSFSAWVSGGSDVEVDADGNVWVLGNTNPEGPWSTFIAVFDTEGEEIADEDFGYDCFGNSLALGPNGEAFITGWFQAYSDFDFGPDETGLIPIGFDDLYVMKLGGVPAENTEDELEIFNAISANGDGVNDVLYIDNIAQFENTQVKIFSRWGDRVWDTNNYNNTTEAFAGKTSSGKELPAGTYYYKIVFADGKTLTGFLSLRR